MVDIDMLNVSHIDYKFVDECEDPKMLKKSLKLLKEDGKIKNL